MRDSEIGPGLAAVLAVQDEEAEAATYPAMERHASSIVSLSDQLGSPVIWPVGASAERVAGAAILMSQGRIRVRRANCEFDGEQVLIFAVAALSPLSIFLSAEHALRQGAGTVRACGIRIDGLDDQYLRAPNELSPHIPSITYWITEIARPSNTSG